MKLVKYAHHELVAAYEAWVKLQDSVSGPTPRMDARNEAWDNYCDHRDSLPLGTTRKRRLSRDSNIREVPTQVLPFHH